MIKSGVLGTIQEAKRLTNEEKIKGRLVLHGIEANKTSFVALSKTGFYLCGPSYII